MMLAGKSFLSSSKSPISGVAQLSIWPAFREKCMGQEANH
jgi:hypothetical protein